MLSERNSSLPGINVNNLLLGMFFIVVTIGWSSYHVKNNSLIMTFITARKRSLRRLCFHRCLSVHRREVSATHTHTTHTHTQTPPGRHPPKQTPPGQTPPYSVHAGIHTLPCPVHAGIRSTSGRYASHWNAFLFNLV